jgi:hypothetical protein
MSGITDLKKLLRTMQPTLQYSDYVFCTVQEDSLPEIKPPPVLKFREQEGITIIIDKEAADEHKMQYESVWSMITLNVHSDLAAVGLLAAVTDKLAENDISVNVVSAFYHDHLFVPVDRAREAVKVLKKLSSGE